MCSAMEKTQSETVTQRLGDEFIRLEKISKSFNGKMILNDLSFSINKGEFFALLGASGCGKSTLLRILAGFEKPSYGRVFIDGIDVTDATPGERGVSMMFQSYALFPNMTVRENIMFGIKQDKLSKNIINEMTDNVLSLVELDKIADKRPDQISGGQKQRAALARSIVKRPKLLLLDEPLSALDKALREKTQFELVNILEKIGITCIMVTHDQTEAMTMANLIGILYDGHLIQIGTPHEIYEFPNSMYVASFVGDTNVFRGVVSEVGTDYLIVQSDETDCSFYVIYTSIIPVGTHVSVAVRPEKIMVSQTKPAYPRNWTSGVVKEIGYCGSQSIYYVKIKSGKIVKVIIPNLVRLTERCIKWEDTVYIIWRAENCMVLTT